MVSLTKPTSILLSRFFLVALPNPLVCLPTTNELPRILQLDTQAPATGWDSSYRASVRLGPAKHSKVVEEGYTRGNTVGSYVQLSFESAPEFAAGLVERCRCVCVCCRA